MSVRDRHVVVVGAGVGGLATALLLARLGASVTLLERRDSVAGVGAGILGANSALVDAAVLAAELAADGPVEAALQRYQQRRRGPVRQVQDRADLLTRVSHIRASLARRGRDLGMRALDRLPGAGQHVVRAAQQEEPAALLRRTAALLAAR